MFGAETWLILAIMAQRLEVVHMGFLQQVTKSKTKLLRDELWQKSEAKKVLQGVDTQPLQTYLEKRQAIVAEWVVLRPIFDVCARDTGYEGGERLRVPWWRQAAVHKQLKVVVEAILAAARVW